LWAKPSAFGGNDRAGSRPSEPPSEIKLGAPFAKFFKHKWNQKVIHNV